MSPIIFTGIFSPDIFLRTRSALHGDTGSEPLPAQQPVRRGTLLGRTDKNVCEGHRPRAAKGSTGGHKGQKSNTSGATEGLSVGHFSSAYWLLAGAGESRPPKEIFAERVSMKDYFFFLWRNRELFLS